MSKLQPVAIEINIRNWVLMAPKGASRRQRQAIDIALNTIATCQNIANKCSLKGGILMGLLYGSPRLTGDIDLSLAEMPTPDTPEEFCAALDAYFEYVAFELGHPNILMRVHSVKRLPKRKFDEATFPGLQLKMTFVDKNNAPQLASFYEGRPIEIIDMDISFNEPAEDLTVLKLSNEREIMAYGLAELIAEKYRALHQQILRKRNRRQDAYDIWYLFGNNEISDDLATHILERLREKSESRGIIIGPETIAHPDIKNRAKADWNTQKVEIGEELPDFELCWKSVLELYNLLPWDS